MFPNFPKFKNFQILNLKFQNFKKYSEIRGAISISDAFITFWLEGAAVWARRWSAIARSLSVRYVTISSSHSHIILIASIRLEASVQSKPYSHTITISSSHHWLWHHGRSHHPTHQARITTIFFPLPPNVHFSHIAGHTKASLALHLYIEVFPNSFPPISPQYSSRLF